MKKQINKIILVIALVIVAIFTGNAIRYQYDEHIQLENINYQLNSENQELESDNNDLQSSNSELELSNSELNDKVDYL